METPSLPPATAESIAGALPGDLIYLRTDRDHPIGDLVNLIRATPETLEFGLSPKARVTLRWSQVVECERIKTAGA